MEPMNDRELNELLRQWKAPAAPTGLKEKLFTRPEPDTRWRWLLHGSIRVPVPVGAAILAILIVSIYAAVIGVQRRTASRARQVSLSDFRPVTRLEVRIIRSAHENH
jgi:hypothetical protein